MASTSSSSGGARSAGASSGGAGKATASSGSTLQLSASLLINDQNRPRDGCAVEDEKQGGSFSVLITAEDGSVSSWALQPRKSSPGQEFVKQWGPQKKVHNGMVLMVRPIPAQVRSVRPKMHPGFLCRSSVHSRKYQLVAISHFCAVRLARARGVCLLLPHAFECRCAISELPAHSLLTGGGDNLAAVLSAEGDTLAQLQGHQGPVGSACFLPDGRLGWLACLVIRCIDRLVKHRI